jgi:transposase
MQNLQSASNYCPQDIQILLQSHADLQLKVKSLEQQLVWFKRQLFGEKSEKFDMTDNPYQVTIGDVLNALPQLPTTAHEEKQSISYQRGKAKKNHLEGSPDDSGLRFDDSVPVKEINIASPELEGPDADNYEIIDYKNTYRLAKRPSSYVVLKYIRTVLKEKSTLRIITPAAADNVLDKSFADVSFLAGLLIDKFCYHQPLYRQHQRLQQNGIQVARSTLTNLVKRSIELLKPIAQAQKENILMSRVLSMDETPIKAGKKQKGKLNRAYFWPIYGEQDEVCFTFSNHRTMEHLEAQLIDYRGTLLTDGYGVYEQYQKKTPELTHAQCWVHARRYFERSAESEPEATAAALTYIARLYTIERQIKDQQMKGTEKQRYRQMHSKVVIDAFYDWCHQQTQRIDLVNSNPLSKALNYIIKRRTELTVYISDPEVPMDTNHLERALRVIPMGRKNWMFCWTEMGAEHVGIIQSLLVTCKLHQVNFYDYLVDVLQRISSHPASKVAELTPRLWKTLFADNPIRSDLVKQHHVQ